MHVVYVPHEPPPTFSKSIFLAGPSPRGKDHLNWRPEALRILEEIGYDGVVFVPLPENIDDWRHGYDAQIEWERRYLEMADEIVFWIPRDKEYLPGFTTNVEFGMYYDTGKVVLGSPHNTPHMGYLEWHAKRQGAPIYWSLRSTLQAAVGRIGEGASRVGGERDVPLLIWRHEPFQEWYVSWRKLFDQVVDSFPRHCLHKAQLRWVERTAPHEKDLIAYALEIDYGLEGSPKRLAYRGLLVYLGGKMRLESRP